MLDRDQGAALLRRFDDHDRAAQPGQDPVPTRKMMRPGGFSREELGEKKALPGDALSEPTVGGWLDQVHA
jgi:hypothetical protein